MSQILASQASPAGAAGPSERDFRPCFQNYLTKPSNQYVVRVMLASHGVFVFLQPPARALRRRAVSEQHAPHARLVLDINHGSGVSSSIASTLAHPYTLSEQHPSNLHIFTQDLQVCLHRSSYPCLSPGSEYGHGRTLATCARRHSFIKTTPTGRSRTRRVAVILGSSGMCCLRMWGLKIIFD